MTEDQTVNDLINDKIMGTSKIFAFLIVPTLLTLFFIEGFRAYVPGIYIGVFHVVFQDPGWIFSLFVLITIAILLLPAFTNALCDHFGQERIYFISIIVIAISRLIMAFHLISILETILSVIIIGFYGIFISIFLKNLFENELDVSRKIKIGVFSTSVIAAFLIDAMIRTLGLTTDISLVTMHFIPNFWYITQYAWLLVQVPLSILVIYFSRTTKYLIFEGVKIEKAEEIKADANNLWILISLGLGMFFFVAFNFLLYPGAIVEFTTVSYASQISYNVINPIFIGSITFSLIFVIFFKEKIVFNKILIMTFNAIFAVALILFIFVTKLFSFSIYFFAILMTVSVFFLFLDLHVLLTNIVLKKTKYNQIKTISNAITVSLLFYILFSFIYDFTTDHAFTIEALQGLGPHVLLACGLTLVLISILAIYQLSKANSGGSN
ncbi:MAG: hypothetical protein ACTSX4_00215 [Candidatus Helarchaeota archaeon]